nr:uncharacterized protein LOC126516643 [Dermacentor andersoni]
MEATGLQLMELRLANERLVAQDGRRMSVIALAFTLKSVSQLAERLFDADLCKYICTRNLNHDPLEMYFSCRRQRGGWNNNPSAAQSRHAYRQTIVHAAVLGSKNANVTAQTEGICLSRSQGQPSSNSSNSYEEQSAATVNALLEHDYFALSEYASEVVRCIGGFVVRATSKHLHCADCAALLTNDTVTSLLTFIKDNGGLIEPSRFVHAAMCAAETVQRQGTTTGDNIHKITLRAFQQFVKQHEVVLHECTHYSEDPQHVISLTKVLQKKYITLRMKEIGRRRTEQERGAYLRHVFTKRVLFAHQ